jgi:hypothetical protein
MNKEELLKYACAWWALLWALCFGANAPVAAMSIFAGGLVVLYWWGSMFHKANKPEPPSNKQGEPILPLPNP